MYNSCVVFDVFVVLFLGSMVHCFVHFFLRVVKVHMCVTDYGKWDIAQ